MTVSWTWDLEAYISAAWTSIKRDVERFKAPVVASRGIEDSGITKRVASPGSLTCSLDNGESNSAGLIGYYSPEHANMRANFGRDTKVRLKFTYASTDYIKWRGYISDLQPEFGQFKGRSSEMICTDYMQKLVETRLSMIAVQQDQRPDQIISSLISAMPVAPANTSIATDDYVVPFALSSEQDERTVFMGAMQKVCQSALGYVFIGDDETFTYQREAARASSTSAATLNDTMSRLDVSRSLDNVYNRINGILHPTQVDDTADTLLYELDNDIYVDGGDTQIFTFRFRDPNNKAIRVSALDVVTPLVANTHYRASYTQGATDGGANGDLTITDTNGANSAQWEIENTGGARVYINLVNIFGKGIYYYNPVDFHKETGSGDRDTKYDFYYLSDPNRARSYLTHLLRRTSSQAADIAAVSFYADANSTLMTAAMTVDIGDRVTLSETATGISGDYIVNHVSYEIETNGLLRVTWKVETVDDVDFFILNSSVLNGTDVLSPF